MGNIPSCDDGFYEGLFQTITANPVVIMDIHHNRVIRKVRKTQHQNPEFEFGHTQGEIFEKNLQKSTLAFKGGGGKWG